MRNKLSGIPEYYFQILHFPFLVFNWILKNYSVVKIIISSLIALIFFSVRLERIDLDLTKSSGAKSINFE